MLSRCRSFVEGVSQIVNITPLRFLPLRSPTSACYVVVLGSRAGEEQQGAPVPGPQLHMGLAALCILLMEGWLLKDPRPTRQGGAPR